MSGENKPQRNGLDGASWREPAPTLVHQIGMGWNALAGLRKSPFRFEDLIRAAAETERFKASDLGGEREGVERQFHPDGQVSPPHPSPSQDPIVTDTHWS